MSAIEFRTHRRRRRANVNLTSLIDVLFLLLIFFMLTSTFRVQGEMELSLPESTTSTPTPTSAQDRVTQITLLADGSVLLDGEAVELARLRDRILAATPDPAVSRVKLAAEAQARHADVVRLLDLVRDLGFGGVSIGTQIPRFEEDGS